jgi:hypothetical protein
MKKRIQILVLAAAAVLAVGASSFAATGGLPAFKSSSRVTSPPVAAPAPNAAKTAKVKAAQQAVNKAKTNVAAAQAALKAAQKKYAKAKTKGNAAAVARAKAKVKAAQKALAAAQKALAKAKSQA